ncbi:MAG: hypothetical protein KIS92_02715 [Planctomycetota bacterium]|nr:hypothetical protein [Planctomycetota bacterium]
MPDYTELHNAVMAKMDFKSFFRHLGLELFPDDKVDPDGWVLARGCTFTRGEIYVNIGAHAGGWREPITKADGTIYQFVNRQMNRAPDDAVAALRVMCEYVGVPFGDEDIPSADSAMVVTPAAWSKFWVEKESKERLRVTAGITPQTCERYQIGFGKIKGRPYFLVPVPDEGGRIRAIRMIDENYSGRWMRRFPEGGPLEMSPKIFGLNELKTRNWKNVIICDNEFDRILLMQELKNDEWGALSLTDGWVRGWNSFLEGRHVVLCFSTLPKTFYAAQSIVGPLIDMARREEKILGLKLLKLPLADTPEDCRVYHWFKGGGTTANLMKLIHWAPEYSIPGRKCAKDQVKALVSFAEIEDPKNSDLHVRVPLTVIGETATIYDSPTKFRVAHCQRIQDGKCNECLDETFSIDVGRDEHLEACGSSKAHIEKLCQRLCCRWKQHPTIEILEKGTFREVLSTQYHQRLVDRPHEEHENLMIDGRYERQIQRKVVVRVPEGQPEPIQPRGYMATGWIRTNPKNSARTMIVESLEPIPEPYEDFNFKSNLDHLMYLKSLGWSAITQDLIEHRTQIYDCDEIILINLLTYCSPLHINFLGEQGIRGWVTAAIIGDTGVGKSRTFEKLSEIIGIGDIFSCNSGRRTGLTYAVVTLDRKWTCQAGLHPLNTRKILCVEEAQELPREELKSMGEAMEKGQLNINQVARESYESKTRIIFNSNPLGGRTLEHYPYGCMTLKELFVPAFIRRLDMVAFIRKLDDYQKYNERRVTNAQPKVSQEALRALVFFAWSIPPERIQFEDDEAILAAANRLSAKYGHCDDLPLVLPSVYRKTIARLAAAWAILDLSSKDELQTISVTPGHVNLVEKFLDGLYSAEACALDRYSDLAVRQRSMDDYRALEVELKGWLDPKRDRADQGYNPYGKLLYCLSIGTSYNRRDLNRMVGVSDAWMASALATLAAHYLITDGEGGRISITPKYQRFFKEFERKNPVESGVIRASGKVELNA